jgi:precorrin-2 dehydrogenase/sirohydrochlorin ferrochelatase
MRYYPVNLDIRQRNCLVVGGGRVGERKIKTLLECGAEVTVIAREATEHLRRLASEGRIVLNLRTYRPSDLDDQFLVIGATDDEGANQKISQEASKRGILCNIADRPEACTFVLPAIVQQGDLLIAVSTSNKSPAVARSIRQALEKEFGPEYAILLRLMGAVRQRLLAEAKSPEAHKLVFERILQGGLLEMIRQDRTQDVTSLLTGELGEDYTWESLMASA